MYAVYKVSSILSRQRYFKYWNILLCDSKLSWLNEMIYSDIAQLEKPVTEVVSHWFTYLIIK